MSAFTLDIRGQLNNMRLAESKALWPLFEAVVNSIQAIEDSPNKNQGKIFISAVRDSVYQGTVDTGREALEKFESFIITDNGIGMDSSNYRSFNTAYSTLKAKKGCKGIGRFLWLKAFEKVEIESTYYENGDHHNRKFTFTPEGINPENNTQKVEETTISTKVTLKNFLAP